MAGLSRHRTFSGEFRLSRVLRVRHSAGTGDRKDVARRDISAVAVRAAAAKIAPFDERDGDSSLPQKVRTGCSHDPAADDDDSIRGAAHEATPANLVSPSIAGIEESLAVISKTKFFTNCAGRSAFY